MSPQTLHRRFFSLRRSFSEAEQSFFVNIDFINHVALIAVVENPVKLRLWAARDILSANLAGRSSFRRRR